MFYWVYDKETKRVLGPYGVGKITGLPYFCADTKVAPQGSTRKSDWRKVKDVPDFQEAVSVLPPAPETESPPKEGDGAEGAGPGPEKKPAPPEDQKPPEKGK